MILSFETNLFFLLPLVQQFIYSISIVLLNALSYAFLVLKFFRFLCYTTIVMDWIIMINPYKWPFSIPAGATNWYFSFWKTVLPPIKSKKGAFEIYTFIALEFLEVSSNIIRFLASVSIQLLIQFSSSSY